MAIVTMLENDIQKIAKIEQEIAEIVIRHCFRLHAGRQFRSSLGLTNTSNGERFVPIHDATIAQMRLRQIITCRPGEQVFSTKIGVVTFIQCKYASKLSTMPDQVVVMTGFLWKAKVHVRNSGCSRQLDQ
ncbi:unnamed protein product, partial [Protopolystoma xenopodis]